MFAIAHVIGPYLPPALAPGHALALNLSLGAATFAVTVPLAALTYRCLELPCQRLARTWSEAILTRPRRGRLLAEAA
jgi:peptidoglycan/LPS O-acetylase OafA/YrhL